MNFFDKNLQACHFEYMDSLQSGYWMAWSHNYLKYLELGLVGEKIKKDIMSEMVDLIKKYT